jgi:IclR family pca regulon transcriptional regulator
MSRLRPVDAERRRESDAGSAFSEALARGLQIIGAFNETRRQMSLSEVARAIDLPRATARRALHTLVHLGYVESDRRLFRLTPQILRLASAYLTANPVSMVLQPVCDRLTAELGEPCSVAVLQGDDVVMIARAVPSQSFLMGAGIGFRLPAYCSALGRVLLSALSEPEVSLYLDRVPLVAVTPHTVTDRVALAAAIAETRRAGFSYVDQEVEHGFRSVAVPLLRFDGAPVAALHVGAHAERMTEATMLQVFLPRLRHEADSLRGQLI